MAFTDRILKLAGKDDFRLDPAIGNGYIFRQCWKYGLMMVRGKLFSLGYKKIASNVFVGKLQSVCGWVKANIQTGCQTFYEDGTDPVWEKLRLMESCKHFIISNSTFSWWAQYLSLNEDKIVVSPSRWFNNDYESPLIGKDWVRILV